VVALAGGVALLVVVVCAVALAVQARHAEDRLRAARSGVAQLRADLLRPNVAQATIDADTAAVTDAARSAAGTTDSPLWRLATHLPVIGSAAGSARGTATAVRDLAVSVLPDLTGAQSQLQAARVQAHGGIALAPVRTAAPMLVHASAAAEAILARLRGGPAHTAIGQVDTARTDLIAQLTVVAGQLDDASDAAQVLPAMLGGSGTRSYFLGFETEAESRDLGGLPGAFAILQATNGRLTLTHLGSDEELSGVRARDTGLPAAYAAEYATSDPLGTYENSDVSPDFPTAAKIWMGMWEAKTGQRLDGAIVLDPTALGALLQVTGGTTLPDGTVITGSTVAELTEKQAYLRFGADDPARKAFLLAVARASADRLVAVGPAHAQQLARVAAQQAGERRLLVYSAHPAEQAVLAGQPISGLLAPVTGPGAVTGPYLLVGLNNAGGSKLDYYLDRAVTWTAQGCSAASRVSTVTIALTNDAPAGLPTSVTGPGYVHDGLPLDTGRELVTVFSTPGGGVLDVTVDGRRSTLSGAIEQGRPASTVSVTIPRGATTTIVMRLRDPVVAGAPTLVTQPLVRPQTSRVFVPTC
jgi:hypothetical protein